MLGAYFAYEVSRYIDYWAALVLAPLLCALFGAAIEKYGLRKVHRHGHLAELLFTFGLAFIIDKAVPDGLGAYRRAVPRPAHARLHAVQHLRHNFAAYRGFMLLVSALMFGAIWVLLKRTRVGLIIQASLTHPEMVGALGQTCRACSPPCSPADRRWPASPA